MEREVPPVKWVAQEDANGCGIACLAMLVGKTYQQVASEVASVKAMGLSQWPLDSYLAEQGYAVARRYPSLVHLNEINKPGVMRDVWPLTPWADVHLCGVTLPQGHHWVVLLRDGRVLDPAGWPPRSWAEYENVSSMAAIIRIGS